MAKSVTKAKKKLQRNLKYKEGVDACMPDPDPNDIIIPIMGPTGTGKSSFINAAMGQAIMEVGHQPESCTQNLAHAVLDRGERPSEFWKGCDLGDKTIQFLKGRRIILLDTPGFDDTYVNDIEILRRIAVWLSLAYNDEMKLAGVIYLHDISQSRVTGSTRKNLQLFHLLCGDDALKRVVLATSKWGRIPGEEGEERESWLKQKFWNGMIPLGAQTRRFNRTEESTRQVVAAVLQAFAEKHDGGSSVEIQPELAKFLKLLPETDAGHALRRALDDAAARDKMFLKKMAEWSAPNADPELREKYEENRRHLEDVLKQIDELKIPLSRRFLSLLRRV